MRLTPFQRKVLTTLVRQALKDHAFAYPAEGTESHVSVSRVTLTREDAAGLVALGLLREVTSGTLGYEITPEGVQAGIKSIKGYKPLNVESLIREVISLDFFNPSEALGGETAIPAIYEPGDSRLVLVLGENAGGKSFFRRLLHARCRSDQPKKNPFRVREFISLSMQGRTTNGIYGVIYGSEQWQSTGQNSAHVVDRGIHTARTRSHKSILYWDEPDIGMSPGAAAGVGAQIRDFVLDLPPLVQAVFLTSHSLALVRQFRDLSPHYLYLGDENGPKNLDAWIKTQENPTPVSPKEIVELGYRRYRQIQALLK